MIKLGLGCASGMILKAAPSGIKFALGENVKQANWGDKYTTRFPQSRMGVKTFFANRFTAALQYGSKLHEARTGKIPPIRRNLELEAIMEIIEGERLIHCHSYRQDEILVFLRTMESFGVRVGSLQHVLEGYKVADKYPAPDWGVDLSDWWAYKFEVYDAIPYAGALMHERGCVVSFNSDSPDHARRMNLEAAKAVKYGRLSETEALKFVTLNPAKQLGIDKWVGSLEVGKDADLAIWSTNPLDYGPCVSRLGLTDDCVRVQKKQRTGKSRLKERKVGCPDPQIHSEKENQRKLRGSEGKNSSGIRSKRPVICSLIPAALFVNTRKEGPMNRLVLLTLFLSTAGEISSTDKPSIGQPRFRPLRPNSSNREKSSWKRKDPGHRKISQGSEESKGRRMEGSGNLCRFNQPGVLSGFDRNQRLRPPG